ncbi:MAG TPA: IS110 family transposase [Pseudonocardiaceae bacterium]|nr:IS110 family transposase [Pseudonocardiaceae bacterium]
MEVVSRRCCGLDVHKKTVVACVLTPEGRATRTFGTMTGDLLQLADWLLAQGVSHVAMESTGVLWKPIYNLFEGLDFQLLVVNAHHIKQVPGRKTDVKDAEWIAQLLRHGLLRGSRIPDRGQRELQELVRARTTLVRERGQVIQRIQKVLEGANIKLSAVATDVVGVSGRAMLEALIAGTEDAAALAELARGRLKNKRAQLEAALHGLVGPHQRCLLASHLRHLDFLDAEIARLSEAVAARLGPQEETVQRLDGIPGVGRRVAEQLLAELGLDLSDFPTAAHLASWARLCPGNNESAGKRKSGRTGKGNGWLRAALTEAAWAAARTRNTYLSALYHRLTARRGAQRAIVAVAHTILVIAYHLLRRGTTYQELGGNYFEEQDRDRVARRSVQRLERLGYKVTVEVA